MNGPVALFGPGGEALRSAALAAAEAARPVLLATIAPTRDQEFATASIANELWALGAEHLHRVVDAADPAATAALLAELEDRHGPLAACLIVPGQPPAIPFDEFSIDEWLPAARDTLGAALVIARAAAPLLERRGGGTLLILDPADPPAQLPATAASALLVHAIAALPGLLAAELSGRPVQVLGTSAATLPTALHAAISR